MGGGGGEVSGGSEGLWCREMVITNDTMEEVISLDPNLKF